MPTHLGKRRSKVLEEGAMEPERGEEGGVELEEEEN